MTFSVGRSKNAVYTSKPRTLQNLRRYIETAYAAVPLATQNVCPSVACRQQYIAAGGGLFEYSLLVM
jgi:hypothetical protein